ncbi:MAG: hypothetical protein JSS62_03755 [Verrucomicrobia bacterium]|nr:hypothetical protein [Verrucomicrobiota bacterium]MBS0645113.1 hypothetical protein [Verrucomicrobiota bacterium]
MLKTSLIVLLLTCSLYALPVGNPAEPVLLGNEKPASMRLGYYNDSVGSTPLVAGNWTQQARWMTNSGQVIVNVLGRMDFFAGAGISTFRTSPHELSATLPQDGNANACLSVRALPSFSYSLGMRGTLLRLLGFSLGAEAEVLRSHPRPFFTTTRGLDNKKPLETTMTLSQRQIGIAASYTLPTPILMIPYAGMRWRQVNFNFDQLVAPASLGTGAQLRDLQQLTPWGSVLGLSLVAEHRWTVSLEGDIWQQPSGSLIAQLRY